MNKKFLLIVLLILTSLIILTACGGADTTETYVEDSTAAEADTAASEEETAPPEEDATTEDTAEEPAAEDAATTDEPASGETVNIGALLPLSEPGAPQAGQLILRGIEMAAEYVNTELGGSVDGRPVAIVVEDDKGTPEVGASGYRRLVQEENIIGATGCYHSSVCLAVIEVAKELGAPYIITQGSNAAITESAKIL